METYKNKAKCGFNCTKRAKYRAVNDQNGQVLYACPEHKDRIAHMPSPTKDSGSYTEADYQTWMRL